MKTFLYPSLIILLGTLILGCSSVKPVARTEKIDTLTGDFELVEHFKIPQLDRETNIIIYLPPGYKKNVTKTYPVLYMTDGQNVFNNKTAFKNEWKVDETIQSLVDQGKTEGIIVIGVYNTSHRGSEYLTWDYYFPWNSKIVVKAEGEKYAHFFVETLKTYIDGHFRTKKDPESTAIAGSSWGAQFAIYAGLAYPEVYSKIGAFSYARVNEVDPTLPEKFFSNTIHHPYQKLYMDFGVKETTESLETVQKGMDEVKKFMVTLGYPENCIKTYVDPLGEHNETTWAKNFPTAVSWMFDL